MRKALYSIALICILLFAQESQAQKIFVPHNPGEFYEIIQKGSRTVTQDFYGEWGQAKNFGIQIPETYEPLLIYVIVDSI